MDVNDDILGLVLERVGSQSHVSLIRAAAVCRRWRRAIADAAFLRRLRSLHAPAVAGEYHHHARTGNGPVFLPSSPSMVDASRFSLDFLPGGAGSWSIVDSRGSLLLLLRRWSVMVVCEPLTRSCCIIPRPADLHDDWSSSNSYLIDGFPDERGGCISMSNFRVLCMFRRSDGKHVATFTIGSLWSKKNIAHIGHMGPGHLWPASLGRAGGSWYFYKEGRILIDLNGSTGDFTSSVLPAVEDWSFLVWSCKCFVAEGRDGKPRIITLFDNTMKVFARVDGGEWTLKKSVLLSEATRGLPAYQPSFFSQGEQHILTRGTGFVILSPRCGELLTLWLWPFSIDIETMEVERVTGRMGPMVYRCELPWPPAFHACLDR